MALIWESERSDFKFHFLDMILGYDVEDLINCPGLQFFIWKMGIFKISLWILYEKETNLIEIALFFYFFLDCFDKDWDKV